MLVFSIVFPTLLLLGLEGSLRLLGVAPTPDRTNTWFADHVLSPPLWHEGEMKGGPNLIRAGQAHHFHPFGKEKLPDTLRIAVFGGSAAHGYGGRARRPACGGS